MLRNTAWTPVLDRLKARCQEAESERDALRAEVEKLTGERDAFKGLLWNIHMNLELSQNMNPDQMRHALGIIKALSEAGK